MELVALLTVPAVALLWSADLGVGAYALLALWCLHYGHRALVYPLQRRSSSKRLPILIPAIAIPFNLLNGYVNGWNFVLHGAFYDAVWLMDPRFIVGTTLFFVGMWINISADNHLLRLQNEFPGTYQIPKEGLHKYVASPNYLGEVLEWIGWAIATWSIPGMLFAIYTFANLAPRAHTHHTWYKEKFTNYPPQRKRLIPYMW